MKEEMLKSIELMMKTINKEDEIFQNYEIQVDYYEIIYNVNDLHRDLFKK